MLRSARSLQNYKLQARNGDVGTVYDFYFDDESWAIRYLIADTGNWLRRKRVLILPAALGEPNWETKTLTLTITKQQIEDSPSVDMDKPVSRQKEEELFQYYGWPPYWLAPTTMFTGPGPRTAVELRENAEDQVPNRDTHLRSIREVIGYRIDASDGDIGHVDDFLIEDDTWIMRHMIVDTRNWLPGKQVLVALTWIEAVEWDVRSISVDLPRESIRQSPEFDRETPVSREYEAQLFDYYQRPGYWEV